MTEQTQIAWYMDEDGYHIRRAKPELTSFPAYTQSYEANTREQKAYNEIRLFEEYGFQHDGYKWTLRAPRIPRATFENILAGLDTALQDVCGVQL